MRRRVGAGCKTLTWHSEACNKTTSHSDWFNMGMREVQATDAKAHLARLLRAVERGESIAITRHGRAIAHLVPAQAQDHEARKEAVARFRTQRAGWGRVSMSTPDILGARHEGHRM